MVLTINGGMGRQCASLHRQLARLLCAKKQKLYSTVMAHMRTRLRFGILRSTLIAIRGYGGKPRVESPVNFKDIDFGLVTIDQAGTG